MAYGKDTSQLNRIVPYGGSLSQRAHNYTNTRKQASETRRGGGGGAVPYWKDTLKLSTSHSRILRLIPGQYEQNYSEDDATIISSVFEYFIFREHYHGGVSKGAICSAGPLFRNKSKTEPCEGCTMFWEDMKERKAKKARGDKSMGPNRMSMTEKYVFTVWDYGLWLRVPQTDASGNVRMGQQGTPYYDWVAAASNDPRVSQLEHTWGRLLAWPVGETYKDTLLSYNDETIQKDCATCGSQGSIKCVSKICGNPDCGFEIFDPNNTTLNPEQIEKMMSSKYTCPVCGQSNFIDEMIECQTCLQNGLEPRRASIFDVDLEVKSVAAGKGAQTILQILNRSTPRQIQVADPEVLKTIVPMDLARKFSPTPVEKQRELWGIVAPIPGVQSPVAPGQPAQSQLAPAMPAMGAPMAAMPGMPGRVPF